MRILFAAHAPWRGTGYGTPVIPMVKEWRLLEHQVDCLAVAERGPGLMRYEDINVALPMIAKYGTDVVKDLVRMFKSDAIISMFDPWVLNGEDYSIAEKPWYAWFPIDQDVLIDGMSKLVSNMAQAVVYSQYAADRLPGAVVIEPPIEVDVFTPGDKAQAKRKMGMDPDTKIIGMVGSNLRGDRKALEVQVRAFAAFAQGKPDYKLVMLVNPFGDVALIDLIESLGMRGQVLFVDPFAQFYPLSDHSRLVEIYRAFDVLLHASAAEGFGMCIAEAMACGVPVIYANNTSQPEVTGGLGYAVTDMQAQPSPFGGQWHYPTIDGLVDALERWDKSEPIDASVLREHVMQYAPVNIAAKWQEVLG